MASSTITKSLASDVASLNDRLANNLQIEIIKILQSSSATHEYTMPSGSRHLVMFADGYSGGGYLAYWFSTGGGAITLNEIFKGTHISNVVSNEQKVTFTLNASSTAILVDFVLAGDAIS